MSALYVYALVESPHRPMNIEDHRIHFVAVGGIQAAVERLVEAPQVSEANLRTQHDIVVHLNRRLNPILPARFGALVEFDELDRLISIRRGRFLKAFDRVRGADQMTVRMSAPAGTPHLR